MGHLYHGYVSHNQRVLIKHIVIIRIITDHSPHFPTNQAPVRWIVKILMKVMNIAPWKFPIGSLYGIYANIWGILMVNVTIYSSTMDPMGFLSFPHSRIKAPVRWWLMILVPKSECLCISRRSARGGGRQMTTWHLNGWGTSGVLLPWLIPFEPHL